MSELSGVLSLLTNASNDLGEKMQYIYEKNVLQEKEGKYYSQITEGLKMEEIFDRIKNACDLLEEFKGKVVEERGDNHE